MKKSEMMIVEGRMALGESLFTGSSVSPMAVRKGQVVHDPGGTPRKKRAPYSPSIERQQLNSLDPQWDWYFKMREEAV